MLSGEVPSFYMVQVAQTLVAGLSGIEEVESRLHVRGISAAPDSADSDPPERTIPSPKSRLRFAGPSWDEALSLCVIAPSF